MNRCSVVFVHSGAGSLVGACLLAWIRLSFMLLVDYTFKYDNTNSTLSYSAVVHLSCNMFREWLPYHALV
jgi:hypothetical protein